MQIPIILGTTRKNNQSQKVANFLIKNIEDHADINTHLLDLGKANFPIMEERLEVWENPPQLLMEWIEALKLADAIIIVAPEYKNAYPGSLKNLLDLLPAGIFKYKPIGIASVSAGQYGGTNCLAQLRLVSISLGGLPIPDRLQISHVVNAFDLEGNFVDSKQKLIANKFLLELFKYAKALSSL